MEIVSDFDWTWEIEQENEAQELNYFFLFNSAYKFFFFLKRNIGVQSIYFINTYVSNVKLHEIKKTDNREKHMLLMQKKKNFLSIAPQYLLFMIISGKLANFQLVNIMQKHLM